VSLLPSVDPAPLSARFAAYGDRVALLGAGAPAEGLTYAALVDRVAGFAARLGTTRRLVLVEGANHVDALVAYLGAHAAGCPVLLTGPGQARRAVAVAYDPDVSWTPDDGLVEHRPAPAVELHPDLALLLSTSGTTGSPKLVRLSRANVLSNAAAIVDYLAIREDDVAATTLPMHYCYGLSVVHSHLLRGAALLLTDDSVADASFWADVRRHGVTSFAGVPHTFDLLDRTGFADLDLPSLRYLTQAGGRMAPETVRRYARLGQRRGWDLVVMYGATEATARMAWLPPLLAADAPGTIGIPIPGGSFTIEPLPERPLAGPGEPEVGELVYRGRNVMLGYAESPADLALGRTVHELRTGDVGRQREDGLFEIVGRRSRFAKVFGLRIDLDRVERVLAGRGLIAAAADGGDRLVVAVGTGAAPVDPGAVMAVVRDEFGLAPAGVRLLTPTDLPRLPNGKTDYRTLVEQAHVEQARVEQAQTRTPANPAPDVAGLFAAVLGRQAGPADSFVSLGGDSLSYVEVSLRLEELLGALPAAWHTMPARDLERAASPPARRWGRLVETNVLLRAFAIVSIVGTHANLFTMLGGAHLLLGVVGFNFGRFQVRDSPRAERVAGLLRSVARIAVPSALVIGTVSLYTDGLGWRQVLLVNGLTSGDWSEPGWHYWFIEALVDILVVMTAVLAVPAVDRLERRFPFGLPFGLAVLGLTTRYGVVGLGGTDEIHRAHVIFWLFGLGWAAAKVRRTRDRVLLTVLMAASVPGFFDVFERNAYIVVGMTALFWVRHVRVPALLARPAGWLAAASLWIYLVHWQVYPSLEYRIPVLATVLSLVAGVLAWRLWSYAEQRVARFRE
jgi:acyl-CoA synthetase (AMP-forming)/AMP-acid ligase II